jgi:predicted nucleic acid-binding protein
MSRYLVFDTSVIIPYITHGAYAKPFETALRQGIALIPAPVFHELYAGTRSKNDKVDVDCIYRSLKWIEGILTPSEEDWATSGIYMARYIRLFGEINPKDHIFDLLISILACNAHSPLVTKNTRDMLRWQRILRAAGKSLMLYPVGYSPS